MVSRAAAKTSRSSSKATTRSTPPSQRSSERRGAAAPARSKGGRPRSTLSPEQIALLGEPPVDDPLKMMRWWHASLAKIAWLRLQGRMPTELAQEFRATAKVAAQTAPLDVIQYAEDLVKRAEEALGDEAERGPEVEEVNDGTRKALRRPGR